MAVTDDILAQLGRSTKPLIICDVDEVVLEFLDPFQDFLNSVQHRLHADSFRLHGNIRRMADGICATDEAIEEFQETFFATQDRWQRPAAGARAALDSLKDEADIVLLTAMPPRHATVRRALLDLHEFRFPMIATEEAKGPIASNLVGGRDVPVVFIDDIYKNLHSVRDHVPACLLINLMANQAFRALAPDPGERIEKARDWAHAGELIRAHFLLPA